MLTNQLIPTLLNLTKNRHFVVAYSGGIDSHVLLHALASYSTAHAFKVRAIYINHGLQKESTDWEAHCKYICHTLGVPFASKKLFLTPNRGESIEAIARTQRYQALASMLQPEESLLTAQHLEDQAETVLLQLLRGAGSKGLSAMPLAKSLANHEHLRPLLNLSKQTILNYAKQYHLNYIDDPSNLNNRFDRNFLRNQIIPQLKKKWPSVSATLSRVARHQADVEYLLNHFIEQEYVRIQQTNTAKPLILSKTTTTLPITPLLSKSKQEQKALLRYWIDLKNHPLPSEKKINQLINDCFYSHHDRQPIISWKSTEIRRHNHHLYLFSEHALLPPQPPQLWENITTPLTLNNLDIILNPAILKPYLTLIKQSNLTISVQYDKPNETLKMSNNHPTKTLKRFFQEKKVAPWERKQIPLIYAGKQLIIIYSLISIIH